LGFVHCDLEKQETLNGLAANPTQFIADIVSQSRDTVLTWGFVPDDPASVSIVIQFENSGFKLVWFDGNRPAALREFIKRGTVPEVLFYLQMYRIETSKVIEIIKPVIVDPFDAQGQFKSTTQLLQEIRQQ
jgi:hypothetical protein